MIINTVIFFIVLLSLVMIHELGHFIAAKLSKMRVEEFAFGFPPKLFGKKIGETLYAFNLLPIGGYVKITGESFDPEEREKLKTDKMAFQNRPRYMQVFVLIAGVAMNLFLAAVIFFFINTQSHLVDSTDTKYAKYMSAPKVYVTSVLPNSPSQSAGLSMGDELVSMTSGREQAVLTSPQSVVDFVKQHSESSINIVYKNKNGRESQATISAVYGLIPDRKSVGISVISGQYIQLSVIDSIKSAFSDTYNYTKLTIAGLADIFVKLTKGENVMSSLSGPVGIAKIVGGASDSGYQSLLFVIAILSINLAVFNILPVPALDGGRILFVLYEAVTRRSINYKVQYYANAIGFLLLISLMVITTYFDIFK